MLMRLGGMSSVFAGGCIAEKVLLGPFLKRFAPALLAPSPLLGGVVSKLFGAVIVVNVYVENKGAQTSASWLSGGPSQRQIVPQATPSFGQPRPISRLGRAGTQAI